MRNTLPERIHASILTYAVVLVISFFIGSILPSSVSAADCDPKGAGSCPAGKNFSCSISSASGFGAHMCCLDDSACKAFKATNGSNTNTGNISTGNLKINPEDGCSGGINTALGCIPYDTKGFSAGLLGFLAGVVGIIALIIMLIATIFIMTGGSNPEQVKKGKELFTAGVTGLFFIIFSVTILRIIAGDIIKLPGFIN